MSQDSESIGDLISRGQEFESSKGRRPIQSEDHESKSSGGTGSNTSRANNCKNDIDPSLLQLGANETKCIRNSKVCVYIFLILIAIIFSISTWFFISSVQQDWVAQQFDWFAQGILTVSTINAQRTFALFQAQALQFTTHASTTGQQWPFVTLPMFEVTADFLYNQTNTGGYIAIHPLVKVDQRVEWETYATANQDWVQDAYRFYGVEETPSPICSFISESLWDCVPASYSANRSLYAPAWQVSPVIHERESFVNYDGLFMESFARTFFRMLETRSATISDPSNLDGNASNFLSFLMTPVFENTRSDSTIVAALVGLIPWNEYFSNLLPIGVNGILVVVTSEWEEFTFVIDGPNATYLGLGDLHDPKYDSFVQSSEFAGSSDEQRGQGFTVNVYPTQEFNEAYTCYGPLVCTLIVAAVFLFAISVFFTYDVLVERRQRKVMSTATKSSAIVNSLFPPNVRDRLMQEQNTGDNNKDKLLSPFKVSGQGTLPTSKPIADLFPETTVMFADIAGFTAWSSLREPSQVFVLLESLYNAFDKIANKMKVFKVETIGDSYVAVAGLPEARKDHAEVMARFAHKCLIKMNTLGHKLETILGPGTSELKMRVGLHSGSVTAGVLRGEKSRFQLFGDTVNTAARMESTGVKNRIQLSKETADLIIAGGKEHWVKPRKSKVFAKGKGELQTFWFVQGTESDVSEGLQEENSTAVLGNNVARIASLTGDPNPGRASMERLIQWNVENLCLPLKRLVASRQGQKLQTLTSWRKLEITDIHSNNILLDEVEEAITLPDHGVTELGALVDSVVLEEVVMDQLTNYVATISSMYRPHAFHNFDHASHVAQAVTKLLSRVVTPDQVCYESMSYKQKAVPDSLHDFTGGIISHPLIHFAGILSALIHDVDHPGVPNATLVKEGAAMAIAYSNQSVAEQNSLDLAWGLLMEPRYEDLRRCIYTTQAELESFRNLLVHAVLATDVTDKELGNLRNTRWDRAFRTPALEAPLAENYILTNQKAMITIEYLMQASDVAHTMQHWQIYTLWNEKLFQECYLAFQEGRSDRDPTEGWYDGELAFFDFYVIPLAKRLKECGIFGVCSDEYLNYAISNREEWNRRGKEMVSLYVDGGFGAQKLGSGTSLQKPRSNS